MSGVGMSALARIGLWILVGLVAAALLAPWLAPHDPFEQQLGQGLQGASAAHPLGQDRLGRDVLSRILYGARVSLAVGLAVVLVSLMIGVAVGTLAGYLGGWVDETLMRVVDVLLAFPGLLLAIGLTAVLGPGLRHTVLALCLLGWVGYARLVRGQLLSVREREYILAVRALGAGGLRVALHHLLPNIAAPILVEATFQFSAVILAEASLSFLGLGIQPPAPSWGSMLSEGRQFLLLAPHLIAYPGVALALAVVGLNTVGDGLRDALDVRETVRERPGA